MWFIVVVLMSTGNHILLTQGLDDADRGFRNAWTCEDARKLLQQQAQNAIRETYCVYREKTYEWR